MRWCGWHVLVHVQPQLESWLLTFHLSRIRLVIRRDDWRWVGGSLWLSQVRPVGVKHHYLMFIRADRVICCRSNCRRLNWRLVERLRWHVRLSWNHHDWPEKLNVLNGRLSRRSLGWKILHQHWLGGSWKEISLDIQLDIRPQLTSWHQRLRGWSLSSLAGADRKNNSSAVWHLLHLLLWSVNRVRSSDNVLMRQLHRVIAVPGRGCRWHCRRLYNVGDGVERWEFRADCRPLPGLSKFRQVF